MRFIRFYKLFHNNLKVLCEDMMLSIYDHRFNIDKAKTQVLDNHCKIQRFYQNTMIQSSFNEKPFNKLIHQNLLIIAV